MASEMVSMDSRNPRGFAHCSPTISPSLQQEHVSTDEPASGQNSPIEKANENSKSASQQVALSKEETAVEESTGLPDQNIHDGQADQKSESGNSPKHTEETISKVSEPDIEEGRSKYKPGGFHPVYIGEVYDNRYRILNKIGYGVYSTVWLVKDLQQEYVLHMMFSWST